MKLVAKGYFTLLLSCISLNVFGYIGPGMGGGILAVIIGFFAAIFLGLFAILYYPVKRALKNKSARKRKKSSK
ncbi:hypothetical protein PQZ12_01250 [Methylophilaceae bacterium]|nr:hypothetical protein [Methylophilaceae bacterium]